MSYGNDGQISKRMSIMKPRFLQSEAEQKYFSFNPISRGIVFIGVDFQAAAAQENHDERSERQKVKQTTKTSLQGERLWLRSGGRA